MMISRHEGHGSSTKQFLKEDSMGSFTKVNHLHSNYAYSSGEILSPRSVLEQQRALSGLAIAIDMEQKMKLPRHTLENVSLGRFLSKQSLMRMTMQEGQCRGKRLFLSGERLSDMMDKKHDERDTLTGQSSVGLKMVISLQQVKDQEDKTDGKLLMGRSLSREKMLGMRQRKDERRREALSGGSGASAGGAKEQGISCVTEKKAAMLPEDHLLKSSFSSPSPSPSPRPRQNTWWLHELGHVQQSFPVCTSSTKDSVFYYGDTNPAPPASTQLYHWGLDHGPSVDDFLQCCCSCKCRLRAGKDIYMYRGDQAFCSVECRYEQILKDEGIGASAL